MLPRSQMLFLLFFLLAESHQDEDPKTGTGKPTAQSTKTSSRKGSETLEMHWAANATTISSPSKKVPITISNRFPGNNGRIHKLYYVIPGPGRDTALHRKRTHEIKVRLRSKRDVDKIWHHGDVDKTRYHRKAATHRRWHARQRREQKLSTQRKSLKRMRRGEQQHSEARKHQRAQRQETEREPCDFKVKQKDKREQRQSGKGDPELSGKQQEKIASGPPIQDRDATRVVARTKRSLTQEKEGPFGCGNEDQTNHRLRVQRLERELTGVTNEDWSEEAALTEHKRRQNDPTVDSLSLKRSKRETKYNDYKLVKIRGQSRSKTGRGEVLRIDVGSIEKELTRPRRDLGPDTAGHEHEDSDRDLDFSLVSKGSEPQPIRDLVEVLKKDPGYKGLDEIELDDSAGPDPAESADGYDWTVPGTSAPGSNNRDPMDKLRSDLGGDIADESSRSKRDSGADPDDGVSRWQEWRLKREDADARWRTRTRTPRDHKFVTKSQLKNQVHQSSGERVTDSKSNADAMSGTEEPPSVIKVYSMPEENLAKALRAGKGRELSYARSPTKRIIYYATLPEIIRRPAAPEWLARHSGAFSQRGLGTSFGSSLLPFAAGVGQGGDIARIQSAIMDVRPPRDNLTPTSPQFTVVDIGRFPSLNDITSTNAIGSASSSANSNDGGAPTPASPTTPEDPLTINSILPTLNNNFLSSIVTPLQMNSVNGATSFNGYQPAPYYPGPFPTRHHRFPPPTHSYQPYISPSSLGSLSNYKLDQSGGLGLGLSNYKGSHNLGPGLSSLLSGGKYPYYYEYTGGGGGGRVDPLKNHLLFSPSWGQPTPLYERLPPATHSTHSVVIDSQSININATNVSTGNSTRITPPVVTNVTHHYESHE